MTQSEINTALIRAIIGDSGYTSIPPAELNKSLADEHAEVVARGWSGE